jgi:SNF2 family DNA or RNA helicase
MSWAFAKVKPYAVQSAALNMARGRDAWAYFMEMGTGKTMTTLAEFADLYKRGKVSTLIVVCPNSIKGAWAAEAEKTGWHFQPHVWPEQMDPGSVAALHVVIMNYEAVITAKGGRYLNELLAKRRCMLVLDESINIKNPKARRTRTLIAASQNAIYRRILSGAPVAQGPHDLWAQLRFLGAFERYNYYAYRNHFCRMGGWQGRQIIGAQNEKELNEVVGRWSFRARKEDWLDLPKKIYQTREYELTPTQKKHYKELATDLITKIENRVIEVQMVISAVVKLQQICSGFLLHNDPMGGDKQAIAIPDGDPKLALLDEVLEEVTGKVLIFCMFRHTVERLWRHLARDENRCAVIQGGMTVDEITKGKDRFEKDPGVRYLIVQIQSGKYGHTLLGGSGQDRCATTIFYEHSYSLDNRVQAEDRNHRIGQDQPVVYIDFVGPKIERNIVKALRSKQDVATAIIDGIQANGDL